MSGYQVIPREKVAVSKVLVDMWIRLGKPTSPLTKTGSKMMDILIATWEDLYPKERADWYAVRSEYRRNELSIKKQVKHKTGRSLASYPMYIYQIMKKIFPGFDAAERENCFKMIKKWPMFQVANRV